MFVGSSPLARGLPAKPINFIIKTGIIPARAGFTSPTPCPGPALRDHPRSRGVYERAREVETQVTGSSPLARGLRTHRVSGVDCLRIIPARAGFT